MVRARPIPSVRDLAELHGDPEGSHVHFWAESPRRRWLDLAQQEQQHQRSEWSSITVDVRTRCIGRTRSLDEFDYPARLASAEALGLARTSRG